MAEGIYLHYTEAVIPEQLPLTNTVLALRRLPVSYPTEETKNPKI